MATRAGMIKEAVKLLDAGALASSLPGRLMAKFKLTPAEAQAIAGAAMARREKRKSTAK